MPGTSFLMRSISRPRLSGLQHESPSVGREGGRGGREGGREGEREGEREGGREGGRGGRLYLRLLSLAWLRMSSTLQKLLKQHVSYP